MKQKSVSTRTNTKESTRWHHCTLIYFLSLFSGLSAESHVQQRSQRRPVEQTVSGRHSPVRLSGLCQGFTLPQGLNHDLFIRGARLDWSSSLFNDAVQTKAAETLGENLGSDGGLVVMVTCLTSVALPCFLVCSQSLVIYYVVFPGHALRGAGHRHRRDDGQVDSTNGLPCRHHQQEPIRAALHSLHHCKPGPLPVWRGSPEKQQVRRRLFQWK